MLMNATEAERLAFVARITAGDTPHYRQTQTGDPAKIAEFLQGQPLVYTQVRVVERRGE